MFSRELIVGLIGLLFVVGCGESHVRQRPSKNELIGQWRNNTSLIMLNVDNSFVAEHLPSRIISSQQLLQESFDGKGRWQLIERNQVWVVEFEWEGLRKPNTTTFINAELMRGRRSEYLVFTIGDPDDFNQFKLRRVSKQ